MSLTGSVIGVLTQDDDLRVLDVEVMRPAVKTWRRSVIAIAESHIVYLVLYKSIRTLSTRFGFFLSKIHFDRPGSDSGLTKTGRFSLVT